MFKINKIYVIYIINISCTVSGQKFESISR
jgi:hypothetical protein